MHLKFILAIAVLMFLFNPPRAVAVPGCQLTASDLSANDHLSFNDFDQAGITPATWRQLSNNHCNMQAALAADDYAMNATGLTARELHDVLFHEAQSLAMANHNEQAARLVTAARDVDQPASAPFDWDTYLVGTRAFLLKDHNALVDATRRLSSEPGFGNRINAGALQGLLDCFNARYEVAYSKSCRLTK